jgi:hypothetical protein
LPQTPELADSSEVSKINVLKTKTTFQNSLKTIKNSCKGIKKTINSETQQQKKEKKKRLHVITIPVPIDTYVGTGTVLVCSGTRIIFVLEN